MDNQVTKSKKTHTKRNVIVGIIVVLAIIGIIAPKNSPKTKTIATTKKTTLSNKVPAVDYQVASWEKKYNPIFTLLGSDMGAFTKDAKALNYSAVTTDCQNIESDSSMAQSYPAIPSPSIEQYWSDMLSNLNAGGQDCVSAVKNVDANQMTQAGNEFTKANTDLSTISGALQLAVQETK